MLLSRHTRRRDVVASLGAIAAGLARSRTAWAQTAVARKVGVATSEVHLYEAVVEGLREFGWSPGRDVEVVHGRPGASMEAVDRLFEWRPDVLVAGGAPRIRHAAERRPSTPIIGIDLESDPERSGFVQSLSRPGGSITGIWLDMPEMAGKLVELLREVVPDLSRCAILWDERMGRPQFEVTERAAARVDLAIEPLVFDATRDLELLVTSATASALIVLTSPSIFPQRIKIAAAAARRRMPSISIFPDYARAGGLMAYGPSLTGMFRRSAYYVDAVLRGRSPAELPVERPVRFELVLNQRTANDLAIRFPLRLLTGADEVIE